MEHHRRRWRILELLSPGAGVARRRMLHQYRKSVARHGRLIISARDLNSGNGETRQKRSANNPRFPSKLADSGYGLIRRRQWKLNLV